MIHPTRISSYTTATSVPWGFARRPLLAIDAVLRKLDEDTAGADAVLGQIDPTDELPFTASAELFAAGTMTPCSFHCSLTSLISVSSVSRL